jgi:hypothetical protein
MLKGILGRCGLRVKHRRRVTILQIHTENGSIYQIDMEAKTWERIEHDPDSKGIRTERGTYWTCREPVIGESFVMICEPLPGSAPSTHFRRIVTSIVKSFEVAGYDSRSNVPSVSLRRAVFSKLSWIDRLLDKLIRRFVQHLALAISRAFGKSLVLENLTSE